jgi:hypothetical protein
MSWNWKAGLKEFDGRLQRFCKDPKIHAIVALYFLCDLLPRLPDPIAKKLVDKVLGLLGLGDPPP